MTAPTSTLDLTPLGEASTQGSAGLADELGMTAPTKLRVTATDVKGALERLRGVVVLDLGDWTVYPMPEGLTAEEAEDPTLVVLVDHDAAADAVARTGRPCDAAELLTRELRAQARRGLL